jgi:two-component system sensor histidine kinase/response regulator
LANAIKFSSEGDVIRVSVKEVSDNIEVSVTDEGVGMSDEDMLKLFNAETHFTKPGTNKEKGVGIGLIITKEFIESNGGSIWVTSELGKGSTFTFSVKGKQEAVMA